MPGGVEMHKVDTIEKLTPLISNTSILVQRVLLVQ